MIAGRKKTAQNIKISENGKNNKSGKNKKKCKYLEVNLAQVSYI